MAGLSRSSDIRTYSPHFLTDHPLTSLSSIGPRSLGFALVAALKMQEKISSNSKPPSKRPKILSETESAPSGQPLQSPFPDSAINHSSKPRRQEPSDDPSIKHVLLVDDNAINLKILTTYVKKIGCTLATASNGLEAVEQYKSSKEHFDIVFMGESYA